MNIHKPLQATTVPQASRPVAPAVWRMDVSGDRMLFRSGHHDLLYGHSEARPAWTADDALRFMLEKDKAAYRAAFEGAQSSGRLSAEVGVCWPDGQVHTILIEGEWESRGGNGPDILAGTVSDVTRAATDDSINILGRMLKVHTLAQFGIWQFDVAVGQSIWSDEAYKIFGIPLGTVIPMEASSKYAHPDDLPLITTAWAKAKHSGTFDLEYRIIVEGETRWVREIASLEIDASGKIVQGFGSFQDVTRKHKADEQVRRIESHLQLALESARMGTWYGGFTDNTIWDDRMYEILGLEPQSKKAGVETFLSCVVPARQEAARQRVLTNRDSGADFHNEELVLWPDGQERWVELRGRVFHDPVTGAGWTVGVMFDITERKDREARLEKSEHELRVAQSVAKLGSWRVDLGTRALTWSDETYRIMGEPMGRAITEVEHNRKIHPDDVPRVDQAWANSLWNLSDYDVEYRIAVDGKTRWIRERAQVGWDLDGRYNQTYGTVQDITEQKLLEINLRNSESRLQLALEAGGMGSWDWDVVNEAFVWSDGCYRILGLAPQSQPPSRELWTRYIHPDDVGHVMAVSKEKYEKPGPFQISYRLNAADGRVKWVEVVGRYEADEQGKPTRAYGIMSDISERKEKEAHDRLLMQELNHRAKNLLQVVNSIVQQSALSSGERALAAAIDDRLRGLAHTHDLLVANNWKSVDLEEMIRVQLSHFRGLIGRRILLKGEHIPLSAKAVQPLGMAVHELATNASKYGALSCGDGRIEIEWAINGTGEAAELEMHWRESGGPVPKEPKHVGFGWNVIKSAPEHSLRARIEINYPQTGLHWHLRVPRKRIAGDPS